MKSASKCFQFLRKIFEIKSSRHRAGTSHSKAPSENEDDDSSTKIYNNTESPQCETFVETNTNPTETKQQNPLQIPVSSISAIITERVQNPSIELEKQIPEVLSLANTQAEHER